MQGVIPDVDVLLVFGSKPMSNRKENRLIPSQESTLEIPIKGFYINNGIKYDVRHLYLDSVDVSKWKEKQKYIYVNESIVVYKKDNQIIKLIESLHVTKDEKLFQLIYYIRKIGYRGLVYRGDNHEEWDKYKWTDRVYYWFEKNDDFAAFARLDECTEFLYKLFFTINNQYYPSPKWRYHILQELEWLPESFVKNKFKLLTFDFTREGFDNRISLIEEILTETIDYIDQVSPLPEDINEYYYSHQGANYYTDNTY